MPAVVSAGILVALSQFVVLFSFRKGIHSWNTLINRMPRDRATRNTGKNSSPNLNASVSIDWVTVPLKAWAQLL